MLKHLFGRSSSSSAIVKKKDNPKGSISTSPSALDQPKLVLPKSNEPFNGQLEVSLEQLDDKPVTAYGYEDSS